MRRSIAIAITMLTIATLNLTAVATTKDSGDTTIKDVRPIGTTDKKNKHQQYDISFVSPAGNDYTCRTSAKTSVKATDLVVGSNMNYQLKGDQGKLKTSDGKKLSCTIVRVEKVAATSR